MSDAPKEAWIAILPSAYSSRFSTMVAGTYENANQFNNHPSTEYTRKDISDATIKALTEALEGAVNALDLANDLLNQKTPTYAIPLSNQYNGRHGAAKRAKAALSAAKGGE